MYVAISLEENEHSWVVCNDTDVRKKTLRDLWMTQQSQ